MLIKLSYFAWLFSWFCCTLFPVNWQSLRRWFYVMLILPLVSSQKWKSNTLFYFQEMLNVHEHYQNMKRIISTDKSKPDKTLSLIKDDFFDNIKNIVLEHQQWHRDRQVSRGLAPLPSTVWESWECWGAWLVAAFLWRWDLKGFTSLVLALLFSSYVMLLTSQMDFLM